MQEQSEVRKSTTENISLILYIKDAIEGKVKLEDDTIQFIITTNWDRVYPHFANGNQREAFLELSSSFRERATRKEKINLKAWVNLSPNDLFLFIKKKPQALTQVVEHGYFSKLLEGNLTNPQRKGDGYLLLQWLLQQKDLSDENKLITLLLLQQKLDITDIEYFNTLKQYASAEMFAASFSGAIAKEQWIKDKKGQYFDLWLTNTDLASYIQKIQSFDKEQDFIFCQSIIVNKGNANYKNLLAYNFGVFSSTVKNRVSQYLKGKVNSLEPSKISPALKLVLENCIMVPELRSLFSVAELYKLMTIPGLNPVCHKVISCDPNLRQDLINHADKFLDNLYRLNPYFFIQQFSKIKFSEEIYLNFLAELLLAETGTIKNEAIIKKFQNGLFDFFPPEKLAMYFATDIVLRAKLVAKFTWEKRQQFEKYPLLLSFVLANVKLLQTETDPEKNIAMCSALLEYRNKGFILNENLDEHLKSMLNKHLDLLAKEASNNEQFASLLLRLANKEQLEKLLAADQAISGSFQAFYEEKKEEKIINASQSEADKISLSVLKETGPLSEGWTSSIEQTQSIKPKLDVSKLPQELLNRIIDKLDSTETAEAITILNGFLQNEETTIDLLEGPFKPLADKLYDKIGEMVLTQTALDLEKAKSKLKTNADFYVLSVTTTSERQEFLQP